MAKILINFFVLELFVYTPLCLSASFCFGKGYCGLPDVSLTVKYDLKWVSRLGPMVNQTDGSKSVTFEGFPVEGIH